MTTRSMTDRYEPREIELRWQARWAESGLYQTPDQVPGRENWYALTMFPYTSGDLHVGHWFTMAPSDALARWRRMSGYNVLFPMGFDAFGMPAENAAIKGGMHPQDWTNANIERMRGQLQSMGAMFDWSRELYASSPEYYRWTQWWFLQMVRLGLAYRAKAAANWCPSCQTVLANEQVSDGNCERCDTAVVQRSMEQWFLRTTQYAEELLHNEHLDWPEHVKVMQRNWIGRSEGAEVAFALESPTADGSTEVRVFTTRPDTLHGVTFMVLAPEHALVSQLVTAEQRVAVEAYVETASYETDIERQSTEREKTGVFTGAYCVNRLTGRRVPIWVADYVLVTYGTGAVMAVPAHDERDFAFAQKYALPIEVVIAPPDWDGAPLDAAYTAPGNMVHSQQFDGMTSTDAKGAITRYLDEQSWGHATIVYRLRDWLVSRQRYWGAPIPMIYCEACGLVPVPEDQLPVLLPYDVEFLPTGESPLARSEAFVNVDCPRCGAAARRETDTMDTFMCSSWYFMRYADAHNASAALSSEAARAWLPVDQYTGGAEHATMHLLYARFFYKMARDAGVVSGDEPFTRYFAQGQILGPDGRRMSKSRGNVIAPDSQVERWGADTFRAYLMFLGPWEQGGPYDVDGIVGISRWLHRVWSVATDPPTFADAPDSPETRELRALVHRTIAKVTDDLGRYRMNTMVSALMELTNALQRARDESAHQPVDRAAWVEALDTLALLIAPACPHIAEELWARAGHEYSVHQQSWPIADPALLRRLSVEIPVQVDGRVRERVEVPAEATAAEVRALAEALPKVAELLAGREVARVVYVPGRLLNLVLR
ncbi:MAG: leucine--tRNA ligase [Chloroflexi bacterium]|nr:MAG: leucine--tRNA ligase [Chloroflexota bacterium]